VWVELGQEAQSPRQARQLADRLGVERSTTAAAHLARLHSWAADHAPDGALTGWSPHTIARAAGWRGDPATLLEALAHAGCIQRRPGGTRLRDWQAAPQLADRQLADPTLNAGPRLHVHGLWQAALRELAGMVNRANFEAFLRDTVGLYQNGPWVTIGAPSIYVSDVLAQRFRSTLDRALFDVTGRPLRARVICLPPAAPDLA